MFIFKVFDLYVTNVENNISIFWHFFIVAIVDRVNWLEIWKLKYNSLYKGQN